ncbi:hypothetical protein [Natronobiforma cellulositropha]|uniref:hypothetical protein n=1 Tax=Natronobiforma cellulositropha TaxID=1679076 RepID=UPI0021D5D521|nr:hypothetical protein [Natronobiforma cellulositropha]
MSDHEPEDEDYARWGGENWNPPRCPHCESVVVGVTATGPFTIQASCGCYVTQQEARELRK